MNILEKAILSAFKEKLVNFLYNNDEIDFEISFKKIECDLLINLQVKSRGTGKSVTFEKTIDLYQPKDFIIDKFDSIYNELNNYIENFKVN